MFTSYFPAYHMGYGSLCVGYHGGVMWILMHIARKRYMYMAAKCNTQTIEKLFIQKRFVKG